MERDIKALWNRVKDLLKESGKTQQELCDYCNINIHSFRSRITKGIVPDAFEVNTMATFFNVSVDYLITGNDDNPIVKENRELKQKLDNINEMSKY